MGSLYKPLRNLLLQLPAALSKLTSLRILDVAYNGRLEPGRDAAPEILQALSSLVVMSGLSPVDISALGCLLTYCVCFQVLSCAGCQLVELAPGSLLSIPSLRVLLLHDMNPSHTHLVASSIFVQVALAENPDCITRIVWLSLSLEVALQGLPLLKTAANLRVRLTLFVGRSSSLQALNDYLQKRMCVQRLDVSVSSNLASASGMERLEGLGDTLLGLPSFREFGVMKSRIPIGASNPEAPFCLPSKLVDLMLRLTRSGRVAASTMNQNEHGRLISRARFAACNFDVESLWP